MVLFYLLRHRKKQGEKKKKNYGPIFENISTKRTGFIHQRTGFIRRAAEASPLADETSLPMDEASRIGPLYIFSLSIFSKFLLLFAAGVLPLK